MKKKSLLGQNLTILYQDDKEYTRVEKELFTVTAGSKSGNIETQWTRENGTTLDCALGSCPLDSTDPSKGPSYSDYDYDRVRQDRSV